MEPPQVHARHLAPETSCICNGEVKRPDEHGRCADGSLYHIDGDGRVLGAPPAYWEAQELKWAKGIVGGLWGPT